MKGKIICGFAGIGKSTMAKNNRGVVDLESTPFEKDFDRYLMVAKQMREFTEYINTLYKQKYCCNVNYCKV